MKKEFDITYPAKPDARGTAKKYYDRRAFYFGKHNSPESHILFALWKQRLIETGEPPEVRTLRAELAHFSNASCHTDSDDQQATSSSDHAGAEETTAASSGNAPDDSGQAEVMDVEVHSVLRRSAAIPLAVAFGAILISFSIIGRAALDAYQFQLTDEEKQIVLGHRRYVDQVREANDNNPLRDEIRKLLMERDEPLTPEFHEKMKDAVSRVSREAR